jgi:uncharacterized damage-inducible protein DinB
MVFLQSLGNEVPTTRRVLAAVPEAQLDFKLGDKGRTARELDVAHRAQREILRRRHRHRHFRRAVRRATRDTHEFIRRVHLPLVLYMDFWIKRTVHHRGQLSSYLRAMNAHVPGTYGGSADECGSWRTRAGLESCPTR